jgi:hypothetical protein
VGEGWEKNAAGCGENNWHGTRQAHHVGSKSQEDSGGAASPVGEGKGREEDSLTESTKMARCFSVTGFRFSTALALTCK